MTESSLASTVPAVGGIKASGLELGGLCTTPSTTILGLRDYLEALEAKTKSPTAPDLGSSSPPWLA